MPQIHPKEAKWLKPTTVRSTKPTLVWLTDEGSSVPPNHIQSLSFGTLPSSRVKRNALFVSVSLKLPLPHTKTQMRTHRLKQTHKKHTESHTGIRQCCLFTVWRATVSTHACTRRHTDTRQRGGCVCSLSWQGGRKNAYVCVSLCTKAGKWDPQRSAGRSQIPNILNSVNKFSWPEITLWFKSHINQPAGKSRSNVLKTVDFT